MGVSERRAEIIKILKCRQQERISVLAEELNVSIRTIKYDISELMDEYPIETVRGNGGGVRLQLNYSIYKGILTESQQSALIEAMKVLSKPWAKIIAELLIVYGSLRNKAKIEVALAEII